MCFRSPLLLIFALSLAHGVRADSNTVYTVLAKTGDPVPGMADRSFAMLQGSAAVINQRGDVAFRARLDNNVSGIFSGPVTNLVPVILEGDPVPGLDTNVTIRQLSSVDLNLRIDERGSVAFNATINGPDIIFADNDAVLLAGKPGALRLVARQGESAPGLPEDYRFSQITFGNSHNFISGAPGQTALRSRLTGAVSSVDDAAIWLESPAGLELVAWESMQAPGLEAGVHFAGLIQSTASRTALNPNGVLSFTADLAGPGISFTNNASLWNATTNGAHCVLQEGDPAPVSGASYVTFEDASMNSSNEWCFISRLNGPASSNDQVMVWGPATNLVVLAREGFPAPGTTNNTVFNDFFFGLPVISGGGDVTFVARVKGPDVTTENEWGIWAGKPGALRLVSRRGDPAPGFEADVRYHEAFSQTFDLPTINRWGEVFFKTFVQGEGIGLENNQVLWAGVPGFIRPVMQRNDLVDLGGGDIRRIFTFNLRHSGGGQDGYGGSLNDRRQLLIETVFVPGVGTSGSAVLLLENVIDPDANDLPVILEEWFGLDDAETVAEVTPEIVQAGGRVKVVYRCATDVEAGELVVQRSRDMVHWADAPGTASLASDQSGLPADVKRFEFTPAEEDGTYFYRVGARLTD